MANGVLDRNKNHSLILDDKKKWEIKALKISEGYISEILWPQEGKIIKNEVYVAKHIIYGLYVES